MKRNNIYALITILLMAGGLTACMDFDSPLDTLTIDQEVVDPTVHVGNPGHIDYSIEVTEQEFDNALASLDVNLRQAKGGQYAMRGGKNGDYPGEHAYQRQYSLGPDNYAQYTTVPHYDFMYGTLQSSYDISVEFNPGPNSSYLIVKNAMIPLLNHPAIDSIPEMKAIYLLLFDQASQEIADVHGAFPYDDFLQNKQTSPFTYVGVGHIYKTIVEHIDTAVACLRHYEARPDWYKAKLQNLMNDNLEAAHSHALREG